MLQTDIAEVLNVRPEAHTPGVRVAGVVHALEAWLVLLVGCPVPKPLLGMRMPCAWAQNCWKPKLADPHFFMGKSRFTHVLHRVEMRSMSWRR